MYICIPGGFIRAQPMRARGGPLGPGPQSPGPQATRSKEGPQGPREAHKGPAHEGPAHNGPAHKGPGGLQGPRGALKGPGQPGPEESLGRSVATSWFKHSNRDLLARKICGDMAVFVGPIISAVILLL